MEQIIHVLMVLVILTNLVLLGSSRLGICIPTVGLQGVALGLLPLFLFLPDGMTLRIIVLAMLSIPWRGILFPWVLLHVLHKVSIRREIEPFVGYPISILIGVLSLVIAFWMNSRLALLPGNSMSAHLVLPVAFSTILIGLFLIVSRKLALNQVIGYIILENGIYVLGISFAAEVHLMVELGVLMDAFVAVFVMSIASFRISQEFDHMDVNRLHDLQDLN